MTEEHGPRLPRRIAVPAGLFVLYVLHLAFFSEKPFLTRWIEGCFAFFLALVLALLILRNSPAGQDEPADFEDADDPDDPRAREKQDPDGTGGP